MTQDQFTYWLKGFLEGKQTLTEDEIMIIKTRLAMVNELVNIPYQVQYIPYDGTGNPFTITYCNN